MIYNFGFDLPPKVGIWVWQFSISPNQARAMHAFLTHFLGEK